MNRTQAFYGEAQPNLSPWRTMHGLHLALVLAVDPATGLCGVELRDGSQPVAAHVLCPNANAANGWVWLPQIGDMVAVAFLQGNDSMPVILGSLYAKNDTLHAQNPGDMTIRHQSGSNIIIGNDGTVTFTGKAGGRLQMKANGDIETTHATSTADVTLDSNGVTVTQGNIKAQVKNAEILLDANSAGGGAKVEIFPSGAVTVTPGAGGIINLGGNTTFVARDGDATGPPIGPLGSHTHQIIASSVKVIAG